MTPARLRPGLATPLAALLTGLLAGGPACVRGGGGEGREPILDPQGSLLPVVPPPSAGLEEVARDILRDREAKLSALLAPRGSRTGLGAAYGELGKAYHAFEVGEAAATCYENARRLEPAVFAWHYLLGRVRMDLREHYAAAAALEQALTLEPSSLPALLSLGNAESSAGRLDGARAAYERALEAAPDSGAASFALGRIVLLQGDAPRAIPLLERALAADAGASRVHTLLSNAYRQVGEPEKSRLHLARRGDRVPAVADPLMEEVAETNPRNYAARALQALRAGNAGRAVALLRAESAAFPADVEVRIQLATALLSAGAAGEAVGQYQEALRREPANSRGLFYLGTAQATLGRDQEAVGSFRSALKLAPENAQAHLALAQTLRRLGRDAEALGPVTDAVRLAPASVEARVEQGRLLAHLGRCRDAVAAAEKGLQSFPESVPLAGLLARLLVTCPTMGPADDPRALALARAGFAAQGDAEAASTVALVLAARGDWAEATTWQRRALELLPAESPPRAREALQAQLVAIEARRLETSW